MRVLVARARHPDDWAPYLDGVDAVVNCAGVLQDGPVDSVRALHEEGIGALFAACEQAGARRVIHVSAIGVGPDSPTAFGRSKAAADAALAARDLDWVILRPSVVVGRAAHGGSGLFRALAVLPVVPVPANAGQLQVVQLDDLVETVAFFLAPGTPTRVTLDLAGPEPLTFPELIGAYRRWLGRPPARTLTVPAPLAGLLFRLGDLVSWLGWRPPLRTTSLRELARGAVGSPREWKRVTGISPRPLAAALAAEPASAQERWFAPMYLLKPFAIGGLALYFVVTGGYRLMIAASTGFAFVARVGWPGVYFIADAAIAVVLGLMLLFRVSARSALYGMLTLLAMRIAVAAAFTPVSPFAVLEAVVEMTPAALAVAFTLAILDDR
jgi:uncharacterized protein YbjT (DUF2867 family)